MPMKMTFRWYGEGNDRISLSDIKQIPGVDGIVWALHHKMPGEIWEENEIAEVKRQLDEYGFNMDVVEPLPPWPPVPTPTTCNNTSKNLRKGT